MTLIIVLFWVRAWPTLQHVKDRRAKVSAAIAVAGQLRHARQRNAAITARAEGAPVANPSRQPKNSFGNMQTPKSSVEMRQFV